MNNNEIDPVTLIWIVLAFVMALSIVATALLIREGRANSRKHSMAMHPAGKGRPASPTPIHPGWNDPQRIIPTIERTRHIDRVGFDWTK